jgi:hypothetical protein
VDPPCNVEALVVLQPIRVDTDSSDQEGRLVLANGLLVGVLVRLDEAEHERAGQWFLEVGLGALQGLNAPTFASLPDATRWLRQNLRNRARIWAGGFDIPVFSGAHTSGGELEAPDDELGQ